MFRRSPAFVFAVWCGLASAAALAQGRDFAGTWTPDAEKNHDAPRGGGGAGTGGGRMKSGGGGADAGAGDLIITVDKTSFTIQRASGDASARTVYRLDGKESVNGDGPTAWRSHVKWDADALVVSMMRRTPQGVQSQTVKYYREGDDLVQQVSRPAAVGRPAVTSKTYYRSKAQ